MTFSTPLNNYTLITFIPEIKKCKTYIVNIKQFVNIYYF